MTAGAYVMSWPILDARTLTVADLVEQASADLGDALDAQRLEQAGPVAWGLAVVGGRLTVSARVPVRTG